MPLFDPTKKLIKRVCRAIFFAHEITLFLRMLEESQEALGLGWIRVLMKTVEGLAWGRGSAAPTGGGVGSPWVCFCRERCWVSQDVLLMQGRSLTFRRGHHLQGYKQRRARKEGSEKEDPTKKGQRKKIQQRRVRGRANKEGSEKEPTKKGQRKNQQRKIRQRRPNKGWSEKELTKKDLRKKSQQRRIRQRRARKLGLHIKEPTKKDSIKKANKKGADKEETTKKGQRKKSQRRRVRQRRANKEGSNKKEPQSRVR